MKADVASEGLCEILSVTIYPPNPPQKCLGELRTSLSEVFGIFSLVTLQAANDARHTKARVLLDVHRSRAGHRYVKSLKVLDQSVNPTPCLRCGYPAELMDATPEVPSHFQCIQCHALWFLQPITRSYAD
jgi:hypothetical protein